MAEQLTEQQKLAVTNRGGQLLVSAAAGSGKTKVLVDRMISYLQDPNDPVNMDDFLIITYTKAAASELRGKIADKLSELIAQNPENRRLQHQLERLYLTKISTVHSFCSDVLRQYAYKLDIPGDFRVAEEGECRLLQTRALEELLEQAYTSRKDDKDFLAFVDTQGLSRNDKLLPDLILQVYNSSRCHKDPEAWLARSLVDTQQNALEDFSKTPWGICMISNLRKKLQGHICALKEVQLLADGCDGMEKAAALLSDTVHQLERLLSCATWDDIIRSKEIAYGRISFSKTADPEIKSQITAVRDACKKELDKALRPFSDTGDVFAADMENTAAAARGLVELVRVFFSSYAQIKRNRRLLDFGDLEHKMLELLLGKSRINPTAAARELGNRYREVMVDEYQDSNEVQDAIFSTLTMQRQNCFMVGDVKQSIYQFRLADPQIFLDKYHSFNDAGSALPGEPRKVLLSRNFRSSGAVIEAVNHVFSACMSPDVGGLIYGEEELLREGIPHLPEIEPEVELHAIEVQEEAYAEEAAFTAKRISDLLDGTHTVREGDHFRPICPEDIVILLRSPKSVGMEYCKALETIGIPCAMGGGNNLLETEEVGLLYGLLQVIDNPLQDIPLVAVLSSRLFAFTADDLAALRSSQKKTSFFSVLERSTAPKATEFLELLSDLRLQSRLCSVSQLIEYIFAKTSMDTMFSAMNDTGERVNNLQAFCQMAVGFDRTAGKDLGQFIDYVKLMAEKEMVTAGEAGKAGSVTVMSIHKSKGLEFPVVFLCGLAHGFNREDLRAQVLCHKDLGIGLSCVDHTQRVRYPSPAKKAISMQIQADNVSEELRILYVAMTRARDRLIMTYAPKNLSANLTNLSKRMDCTPGSLLNSEASCPGDWVMYAALQRTEAGELFAISSKPDCAEVKESPWLIRVQRNISPGKAATIESSTQPTLPETVFQEISEGLAFQYPYEAATVMPSKQTATQLKGRVKDQEAAENTVGHQLLSKDFRSPAFASSADSGTLFGNLIHSVLQYISFDQCGSIEQIELELERMVAEELLSEEERDRVDASAVFRFFSTPLGSRLRQSEQVLREFKFSLLMNASDLYGDCVDEKILVQGVVDCAIVDEDGITVIDFKTDLVDDLSINAAVDRYKMQIQTYANALSRIFEKKIKEAQLYFFRLNRFVKVM